MKIGDIVRMAVTPQAPGDVPHVPLPIHGIIMGYNVVFPDRYAIEVYEYTNQGHTCGNRVADGKGWWIQTQYLELIEEAV